MIGIRGQFSRMTAAGLAATVAAGFMLFAASPASAADRNGCSATIDTPHVSTGAGGVIAKGRWQCTSVPTTVFLSTATTGLLLWLCPQNPQPSESYLTNPNNHCNAMGYNFGDFDVDVAGQTYTRWVPPQGTPGAHGSGYWVACAVWFTPGPNGQGQDRKTFTPIWHGSG